MSSDQVYTLGRAIGSLQFVLETTLKMRAKDDPDAWKVHYVYVMENLIDIYTVLEDGNLSKHTFEDVSDELERLVDIYGDLKIDQTLPRGQRIIGGIKQKLSLIRQNRKTLKTSDIEILHNKLKLWHDRLSISFTNE